MSQFVAEEWKGLWQRFDDPRDPVTKLLTPMKRPRKADLSFPLEPLLIFWTALHPRGLGEWFFSYPVTHTTFARVFVFSMSLYLRDLRKQSRDTIELEMPFASKRLLWLSQLFSLG